MTAAAALAAVVATMGGYISYLLCLTMINIVAAVGLNLLIGNSGQISLCHSAFMAVGAYVSALLTQHAYVPFWVSIPIGTVIAAAVGAALGMPARRLSGVYLALATLAFLQIVQIALEEFADITGGVRGMNVPKPRLLDFTLTPYAIFCVVLTCCIASIWIASNLLRSRIGREFNAVRLSPHAAQALGISVAKVRIVAFALSAAYAGFAGGLFSIVVGFIEPNEFGVVAALRQLTFIVVGGIGSIAGSVLGAATLSALPEVLRPVKEYNDLIAAIILLAAMLFMPQGLISVWRRIAYRNQPAAQEAIRS
jgi:branched-chain amino acid transport system permease protein